MTDNDTIEQLVKENLKSKAPSQREWEPYLYNVFVGAGDYFAEKIPIPFRNCSQKRYLELNREYPGAFRTITLEQDQAYVMGAIVLGGHADSADGFTCRSFDGLAFEYFLAKEDSDWKIKEIKDCGSVFYRGCSN